MYQILGVSLKETQYRRLLGVLNGLNKLRHLAVLCGREDVAKDIMNVIGMYERGEKRAEKESGKEGSRKKPKMDEYGRVYALGRRKTSSARVWVIPTQDIPESTTGEPSVTPSQILVNSLPVGQYFTHTSDREKVFRPLKLTGLLTAYNVFCLVRGGGTTGQAEAIAMGLSRALAELEPGAKGIIRQGEYKEVSNFIRTVLIPFSICREAHASRSENGGEEEDKSGEGQKSIYMGQAMTFLSLFSAQCGIILATYSMMHSADVHSVTYISTRCIAQHTISMHKTLRWEISCSLGEG